MSAVDRLPPAAARPSTAISCEAAIEVGTTASPRAQVRRGEHQQYREVVAIDHEQHLVVGASAGPNTELREGAGGEVVVTATDHHLHVTGSGVDERCIGGHAVVIGDRVVVVTIVVLDEDRVLARREVGDEVLLQGRDRRLAEFRGHRQAVGDGFQVEHEGIVARTTGEVVAQQAAHHRGTVVATDQNVVAGATDQHVVAGFAEGVPPSARRTEVVAEQDVVAVAAVNRVVTGIADQEVVARVARQVVGRTRGVDEIEPTEPRKVKPLLPLPVDAGPFISSSAIT
jgi:hypothetical protein